MKTILAILAIVIVYALHQDYWNWANKSLVFGFVPVGLAYHAGFSVLAALLMFFLTKTVWPEELEQLAERSDSGAQVEEGGH